MQSFDIAIVGGATTGSILALALSSATKHKLRIAIIEKSLPNYAEQGGFDARSIALAYGSLQKLAQIQPLASENLNAELSQITTDIQQIHVSDQGHFGKTMLSAAELKLTKLGVVVELAKLGEKLSAIIAQQPNIQCFCPDTVQNVTRNAQECYLDLTSGEQLRCQLLVAADGIQSQLAKLCGVETKQLQDYQQSAIIANVQLSTPHNGQAFERFTAQGPFALLPLTARTMSLVWCVKDSSVQMTMNDEQFLSALQQQFGWKLGRFEKVSQRFIYPLTLQKAETHVHHRLAIVGNASQQIHPVAGQGFNLGMRDLFELTTLVGKAFSQGQDIGEFTLLNQYEQARNQDQTRIMQNTNGLISLFCSDCLPVQILRNLSLMGLSHCATLRKQVAHQALGW